MAQIKKSVIQRTAICLQFASQVFGYSGKDLLFTLVIVHMHTVLSLIAGHMGNRFHTFREELAKFYINSVNLLAQIFNFHSIGTNI